MARYSRSALSMKESLSELNQQRAEQFLNTFYFQYGHRSIADLAHVTTAIERLSLLAAIAVVDEQRWDGQERSTRYQDFRQSDYYTPEFSAGPGAELYCRTAVFLFSEYEKFSEFMFDYLSSRTPRPREMKPEAYTRTLRARAFDFARYLLPLATNTSLGQIVNARTLETQIARLLAHTHPEVRRLGEKLKEAARGAAYNVNRESLRALAEAIGAKDEALGKLASEQLLREMPVCPTLVKHAEASAYEAETRRELRQAAAELVGDDPIDAASAVTLLASEPLEIELATTLLYQHCHFPYEQLRRRVEALSAAQREEIVALGARHRGEHDELLRSFCAGQSFRFDILMDIEAIATCIVTAAARSSRRNSPPFTASICRRKLPPPNWAGALPRPWNTPVGRLHPDNRPRRPSRRSGAAAARRRNCRRGAISHSTRFPQARPLQDGFRRGRLHHGVAHLARRAPLLPQHCLVDV